MSKGDAQMFLYLGEYGYMVSKNKDSLVDRIAISLISKRRLNALKHSKKFFGGVHLNKSGQVILYNAFYKERTKVDKLISNDVKYLVKTVMG